MNEDWRKHAAAGSFLTLSGTVGETVIILLVGSPVTRLVDVVELNVADMNELRGCVLGVNVVEELK